MIIYAHESGPNTINAVAFANCLSVCPQLQRSQLKWEDGKCVDYRVSVKVESNCGNRQHRVFINIFIRSLHIRFKRFFKRLACRPFDSRHTKSTSATRICLRIASIYSCCCHNSYTTQHGLFFHFEFCQENTVRLCETFADWCFRQKIPFECQQLIADNTAVFTLTKTRRIFFICYYLSGAGASFFKWGLNLSLMSERRSSHIKAHTCTV